MSNAKIFDLAENDPALSYGYGYAINTANSLAPLCSLAQGLLCGRGSGSSSRYGRLFCRDGFTLDRGAKFQCLGLDGIVLPGFAASPPCLDHQGEVHPFSLGRIPALGLVDLPGRIGLGRNPVPDIRGQE